MIIDKSMLFMDDRPILPQGSSQIIDLLGYDGGGLGGPQAAAPGRNTGTHNLGAGIGVPFFCQVTQPFTGLVSLEIVLVSGTKAVTTGGFAQLMNRRVVTRSPVYPLAKLGVTGRNLLPDTVAFGIDQRCVMLEFNVVGTPGFGKITAGIVAGSF